MYASKSVYPTVFYAALQINFRLRAESKLGKAGLQGGMIVFAKCFITKMVLVGSLGLVVMG